MNDNWYLLSLQGPNKNILCQLSMLKRKMSQGKGSVYISILFEDHFSFLQTPNLFSHCNLIFRTCVYKMKELNLDF